MANKEVKREALQETQKEAPKKRRRLKRSVRKTLGAVFLASAIAVAAIPTEGLQAAATNASDEDWGTLEKNMGADASGIPKVDESERIYTTGDGKFQFAYVPPSGSSASGNKVAVILGYEKDGSLPGGSLEIPDTVNAYARRSDSQGTGNGYTAIGKNGNFLYYEVEVEVEVLDEDGKPKHEDDDPEKPIITRMEKQYKACDYEDITKWFYVNGEPREMEEFWYYENNDTATEPKKTDDPNYQWIKDISVRYIGNQYLESDGKGGWKVKGIVDFNNKETCGVFSRAGNIVTLKVGEQMSGIGDYAFYGCTNLGSITLNNGLNTIGVGAFAGCINMTSANIDVHSMVNVIGDYAFYNCRGLTSFTVPNQVGRIGNSAFENCRALTTFTMGAKREDGSQENGFLYSLGARVFKNCTSLKNISFQDQFTEEIKLTAFEGCSSLEYIEVSNAVINFAVDGSYDFDAFKADVLPTFYFKGLKGSALHETSTKNQVAFSYFDSDLKKYVYELTVTEGNRKVVYRVDEDDNLVYCGSGDSNPDLPETVSLPETIGPNHITVIDKKTFQNHCELTMITIPSTITAIESEAFLGCHQLKWVIFNNPSSELTIGQHAFQTQGGTCTKDHKLDNPPELNFVGPISSSSVPFDYAMRSEETINNGTQSTTYIKYYSGWPSHLVVQYNPDKDENELIGYPTLTGLSDYSETTYKYLSADQAAAMASAKQKYAENYTSNDKKELQELLKTGSNYFTTDEAAAIQAAVDLVLPEGIEGFKENLFVDNEKSPNEIYDEDKTITASSLLKIDDEAFKGHKNLVGITLSDATVSIGKHAFEDCVKLKSVSLPGTVEELGIRPFAGCESLSYVNFGGGPYFTCENGIIYELASGSKNKIVELLEGAHTDMVEGVMTEGITELYPEAFKGTDVMSVDLSNSKIKAVPTGAFADTDGLQIVKFPNTMNGGRVWDGAFAGSGVRVLSIPGEFINMTEKAFGDGEDGKTNVAKNFENKSLNIMCEEVEGHMAYDFAVANGLKHSPLNSKTTYEVRFFYYDTEGDKHQLGATQDVKQYEKAEIPDESELPAEAFKPGYVFTGWSDMKLLVSVEQNVDSIAQFEKADAVTYTVIFYVDGVEYDTATVEKGGQVTVPRSPTKEGYFFQGWLILGGDGSLFNETKLTNVQANMQLSAQFRKAEDGEYDNGAGEPNNSASPGASDGSGSGGSGSDGNGGSGNGSGSGNGNGTSGNFYTLTVLNGSGSGSYLEGSQPFIKANDPATGQEFDYWSVSPADVKIASTALSVSIITMPASDVTVTAHFKAKSGSSSGDGSADGSNTQRPNGNSGTVTNGGTTVVIDKNGLSNTGVVSATVNGSSDNFTIKITESAEATEAALRALMAEYGDNLDNIKFFPMDISLYDSTGTTKITDTTGLSVSITLPLPDSLITYAGNNRVASVVNDKLERLSARFTTIQGVSCITFTAEHFSPYVIYVNTSDLSSGLVSDTTPKTGDFIHPKWFLSIALACLSFVFFIQKDTRKEKKVKVKVKA